MEMPQRAGDMPPPDNRIEEYRRQAEQGWRRAESAPNAKLPQAWLRVADQYETLSAELERRLPGRPKGGGIW